MQSGATPSKLIVADSELARAERVAVFLSEHGFEARPLVDGSDAILEAESWPADAAVLSIALPGVSGLDVARHLRESFGPSIRLVACSPAADPNAMRRLVTAGFDEIVGSPEPQSILDALGPATRALVERSMRQTVRRIELLLVLGHSLLGSRQRPPAAANVERVGRIVALVEDDIARIDIPRERDRLMRELGALAERVPDPRVTRF